VTPTHEVFGYHPYWMGTAWQNYNYSLISTIAYFSAEATATGALNNLHGWPVTGLINIAHTNGVDVVLCVTLFNNSDLVTLLSNATYRQNLINNLLTQVQAGNADGVNVDFESFPASQKQNMVQFITDLTNTFHNEIPGSQVTLATPAVDWNDGWDYNALATVSDGLFIMGYNYHYGGSSTTGPIAPLTVNGYSILWTVNDYLVKTNNQVDKLILGCPYYGFEWPATSGVAGAYTTDTGSAKFYAEMEGNALSYGKLWHESSQTPWYRYQNPNWIQGWYDDSLSLSLKYDFAINNDLLGVGVWALGYDGSNPELWTLLFEKFNPNTTDVFQELKTYLPRQLSINALYPNPTNSSFMLEFYSKSKHETLQIIISDIAGRKIKIVNMPSRNTHVYSWEWDGINDLGQKLSTGTYILQLTNGQETKVRKVTMVK
jgi:spore germination protein YaaH